MPEGTSAPRKLGSVSRFSIATWIALYGMWVILSGKFEVFHLTVGFLTVALFNWMQMGLRPLRGASEPRFAALRLILYIPWLVWQMVLSSIYVAGLILRNPGAVEPCLIRFRCRLPSVLHRVVLANSITLTPGTLTVDLQEEEYLVHALSLRTAKEVLEGELAARVAHLSPHATAPDPIIEPIEHSEMA
jgi:multicomponent Na+:H+ antiporter subunit E